MKVTWMLLFNGATVTFPCPKWTLAFVGAVVKHSKRCVSQRQIQRHMKLFASWGSTRPECCSCVYDVPDVCDGHHLMGGKQFYILKCSREKERSGQGGKKWQEHGTWQSEARRARPPPRLSCKKTCLSLKFISSTLNTYRFTAGNIKLTRTASVLTVDQASISRTQTVDEFDTPLARTCLHWTDIKPNLVENLKQTRLSQLPIRWQWCNTKRCCQYSFWLLHVCFNVA